VTINDGFLCLNQQVQGFKEKLCTDYKVRYCCATATIAQTPTTTTTAATVQTSVSIGQACGRQDITPLYQRIVGGIEALPNSWPWIVSLRVNDHFCGGTLIDTRHVLTAAHCLKGSSTSALRVIAGLHQRLNTSTARTQNMGVSRIFMHGNYNQVTLANDIAILRLSQPVQLNRYVNLICLPGPDPEESNSITVAGWGSTYRGSPLSNTLQQVTMQVTNVQAQTSYPAYFNVKQQIGASAPYVGGKDSCQGDSGGPLMYKSNGQWYLSGVVSFGYACGGGNHPGVYTRTSAYLNWIRKIKSK
jgi:secreted trypsin-like serine protease